MLKYEDLKERPKELLAATGMKPDEMAVLVVAFAQAYRESYPDSRTIY
jgi:hypothetical protein